jgi:hypothetical protein
VTATQEPARHDDDVLRFLAVVAALTVLYVAMLILLLWVMSG